MIELYFVQNVERGFVGNCLLWWRTNDNGYTCDIDDARIFNKEDAVTLCENRRKYKAWRVKDIETRTQRHVDMQKLRNVKPLEVEA